jgi:hypothetical protein
MRLVTVGVGAQNSPRFAPAGLFVSHHGTRVMIDGGPGAEPPGRVDAWLVTDERAELVASIRRLAGARGITAEASGLDFDHLQVQCHPVVHTSHPTFGYLINSSEPSLRVVWAPEFAEFPSWASGADLMFAEAAGWNRPIRFARGVGGHLGAISVALQAQRHRIGRLVFAHIGRPTIRAIDQGERPPFGEFARDGQVFLPRARPRG